MTVTARRKKVKKKPSLASREKALKKEIREAWKARHEVEELLGRCQFLVRRAEFLSTQRMALNTQEIEINGEIQTFRRKVKETSQGLTHETRLEIPKDD
jgi:hypothetical protein